MVGNVMDWLVRDDDDDTSSSSSSSPAPTLESHFFLDVPVYEGFAPGENHVLNLGDRESLWAGVVRDTFKWLFRIDRNRATCDYPFPELPDVENFCEYPLVVLPAENVLIRSLDTLFPGVDFINHG